MQSSPNVLRALRTWDPMCPYFDRRGRDPYSWLVELCTTASGHVTDLQACRSIVSDLDKASTLFLWLLDIDSRCLFLVVCDDDPGPDPLPILATNQTFTNYSSLPSHIPLQFAISCHWTLVWQYFTSGFDSW